MILEISITSWESRLCVAHDVIVMFAGRDLIKSFDKNVNYQ